MNIMRDDDIEYYESLSSEEIIKSVENSDIIDTLIAKSAYNYGTSALRKTKYEELDYSELYHYIYIYI